VTARWVVDVVQPERDVEVTWQPISLLRKNDPPADSEYREAAETTHNMLRVMESLRLTDGNDAVFKAYWEFGTRIHHDKDRDFDLGEALTAAGLDPSHAAAADDESLDDVIAERMDIGLALVGDDVGTPIIALDDDNGDRVGMFGPVITRAPSGATGLKLWDHFVGLTQVPGVWEIKRTRTEAPDFGDRPVSS
jgi:hypothetical protein